MCWMLFAFYTDGPKSTLEEYPLRSVTSGGDVFLGCTKTQVDLF